MININLFIFISNHFYKFAVESTKKCEDVTLQKKKKKVVMQSYNRDNVEKHPKISVFFTYVTTKIAAVFLIWINFNQFLKNKNQQEFKLISRSRSSLRNIGDGISRRFCFLEKNQKNC